MPSHQSLRKALGLGLLCALFMSTAQAASYQFTGPTYSSATNFTPPCSGGDCANYTLAMRPAGWFSYLGNLAPNLIGHNLHADPNLTSYGFSDGLTTMERNDPGTRLLRFQVWTDGAGNITQYWATVMQWQDNLAGPHAIGDRFHRIDIFSAAPSINHHNWICDAVGVAGVASVADGCTVTGGNSGRSDAEHSNVGAAWSAVPTINIGSLSGNEGNAGVTNFNFTVYLDQAPTTGPVSVEVRRVGGTATAGVDFTDPGLVILTWGIGDASSRTVGVPVNGDTDVEPDETFTVRLTNASGAGLAGLNGKGTIVNDDVAPAGTVSSVPTLSEWALMALSGILALVALGSRRWRG